VRRRRRQADVPPGTVAVARSDQVPSAPPFLEVKVAGERVLLVRRVDGRIAAFEAACPHLGHPLRRGEIDGSIVTCRHHRYRYDLDDGRCVWPGAAHEVTLGLREVGETAGHVWVRPRAGER
jgi:phenylpropionate dioxygenase-like ring-hydroxylating dioxygenase large terminal subunit